MADDTKPIVEVDAPEPPRREKRNPFLGLRKFLHSIGIFAIKDAIQSSNFIEGVVGWKLGANGLIEGTRLRLDNFIGRDDASIVFAGSWTNITVNPFYGGKAKTTTTIGDTFTITFTGTSIGVIAEISNTMGMVSFVLDGGDAELVDLYQVNTTGSFTRSVVYSKTGLVNKTHTLVGTVAVKNAASSSNEVRIQGYVKSPTPGIKVDAISADIFAVAVNGLTDANGYVKLSLPALPTGYSSWHFTGSILSEAVMSDATLTDPKIAFARNAVYLYNGAAATTYAVLVEYLVSKT